MEKIAVIGAGVMGIDVALTLAGNGYSVILKEREDYEIEGIFSALKSNLRKYKLLSGEVAEWKTEMVIANIKVTKTYEKFNEVSWVIDNTTEDFTVKQSLYQELQNKCGENTCYAVNTSCISITRLAALLTQPEKMIGMHFMNPVPLKKTTELVKGFHTSGDTIYAAERLLKKIKNRGILVNDYPGFVSNRLSHLFMNEAAYLIQDQVADAEKVDAIFKFGYGHKMGPLETADLIGLDTVVRSLNILYQSYQDPKYRCCPLLTRMVDAGLLGCKSGKGFYDYTGRKGLIF